jgi:hypothetical protein
MTADELLRTLRTALDDEREGILSFDSALIRRAGALKEAVLRRLCETPPVRRAPLLAALDELQPDLRCNQILLAHACAYLEDARDE